MSNLPDFPHRPFLYAHLLYTKCMHISLSVERQRRFLNVVVALMPFFSYFWPQMGPDQPHQDGSSGRKGGLSTLWQLFQQKVQPSQPSQAGQGLSQVIPYILTQGKTTFRKPFFYLF